MAAQKQIAQAMNAMQRLIAELASQLAEERHRGASLDRAAQVLDRWTTQQEQQPVARLVDTRVRPSNFGSGEEKSLEKSFPVWERKMQNYIISVFPDLREPLEWAAMTAVPITHQLVEQRFGSEADPTDQVTDLEDKMHQVFAVLMQVTEGEANDRSWMKNGWRILWNVIAICENIQDLLFDGKTPYERQFGMAFDGPAVPFGAMVEYHPTSAKDQSGLH